MSSTDLVLKEVIAAVADVLVLDVDEVQPSDSFATELDGDSLGFLDLAFQLEKRLGVKLSFQKVIPEEHLATDEAGVLTPESLAVLKAELPFLDFRRIEDRPLKSRILELLTVEAIAELVRRALAAQAPAGEPGPQSHPQPA